MPDFPIRIWEMWADELRALDADGLWSFAQSAIAEMNERKFMAVQDEMYRRVQEANLPSSPTSAKQAE